MNDLAQVSVMPQNQVQFQGGDVLGFYVEEARDSARGVNVVTTASYTSETVWYASVATLNSVGYSLSAGSSGVLNTQLRGAPVISIETGELSIIKVKFFMIIITNFVILDYRNI